MFAVGGGREAGAGRVHQDEVAEVERAVGLSSSEKGGVVFGATGSSICTRLGPKSPRCSQATDEPGPPLVANSTGRPGAAVFLQVAEGGDLRAAGKPGVSKVKR